MPPVTPVTNQTLLIVLPCICEAIPSGRLIVLDAKDIGPGEQTIRR
jgi:hypothetical protein